MAKPHKRQRNPHLRRAGYVLQAGLAYLFCGLCLALGPRLASDMGGFIFRHLGPRLGASKRARLNLAAALPGLDETARAAILLEMWDNLGRVAAEYPHLRSIWKRGWVEIEGEHHVRALQAAGQGAILWSAHLANWEIFGVAANDWGIPLNLVYRAPNNPHVARLLARLRAIPEAQLIPKGGKGGLEILRKLKAGGYIGMLMDQKLNDGMAIPFFGRDAMTAPAIVQLSARLGVPAMGVRIERLGRAPRFRITCAPPAVLDTGDDREAGTKDRLTEINATIESWVRAAPGQWLWLHRRWPAA